MLQIFVQIESVGGRAAVVLLLLGPYIFFLFCWGARSSVFVVDARVCVYVCF